MHVFDADKLAGNLHARMAKEREQVLALDGKTYTLDSETVVIADDKTARGIAGVMGGRIPAARWRPTNVFIESAWFDPARVARAGRKLGIVSDARYRFERGVDPQFVLPGLELCTQLILEWCGGEPSECGDRRRIAAAAQAYRFRSRRWSKRLGGMQVETDESIRILSRLGFTVLEHGDILHVTPPS